MQSATGWWPFWIGVALVLFFGGLRLMSPAYLGGARRLEALLLRATATPWQGLLVGALASALVHSSSAVTIAAVALVGAGLLPLENALGLVLGANVGTCLTVQFLALDLASLGLWLTAGGALAGLVLPPRYRRFALALGGLGLILTALYLLPLGLAPLTRSEWFRRWLERCAAGVTSAYAVGALATAIIQSSTLFTAATVGLSQQGLISLPTAVALVLGANLGTCTDTLVAAWWGNSAARRVALAHLLLNGAGGLAFLPVVPVFAAVIARLSPSPAGQVALAHLLFNVVCSLVALPFTGPMARWLARRPKSSH
ncbi:MAG: Na/Pi cotransporter family protein [Moorellales bacterium]